jgi:hypothetical protein
VRKARGPGFETLFRGRTSRRARLTLKQRLLNAYEIPEQHTRRLSE